MADTVKATTAAKQAATTPRRAPAKKAAPAAKQAAAKKAPARATAAGWTAKELAAIHTDLDAQLAQMRVDYAQTLRAIEELQTQASDSAGDDQADAGSKTFEREHEMSLAKNRRDLLAQLEHAIERLDDGSYGNCESCAKPIAKARLQAFPGATLCVTCKQREERR